MAMKAEMSTRLLTTFVLSAGLLASVLLTERFVNVQAQQVPGAGFAAVPGQKGGQDIFGPYDAVPNWPRPIGDSLPADKDWTWSQSMDVFAESPNRVLLVQKGMLPLFSTRPQTVKLPQVGPGLEFPVFRLPLRQAGNSIPNGDELDRPGAGTPGKDWRWENCVVAIDASGRIVERWTQWDKMWVRPHDVEISPYDPQKNVWIVDAEGHAVYKFSNDGKKLLLTIGTPRVPGNDDTHLRRPTFLAFMDANTMYLADGYDNTRVIKYDMNGRKLAQWGQAGTPPNEKRPGYWNNVHGIAVDHATRRVFVNDRGNHRIQIFDENGKYLSEWSIKVRPSSLHLIQIGADGMLWTFDRNTQKMLKYDLEGHLQYAWGAVGDFPGMLWGVHGMSVDQEGNLYTASVDSGLFQKFVPRPGANPAYLMSKGIYSAWQ
jgi:hypothetical protein